LRSKRLISNVRTPEIPGSFRFRDFRNIRSVLDVSTPEISGSCKLKGFRIPGLLQT
jgi:hypothetical protein